MAAPRGSGHPRPCPRCLGGRLFDEAPGEVFCIACGYRPSVPSPGAAGAINHGTGLPAPRSNGHWARR